MVTYVPEINAIFTQMEVPLSVAETPDKGKHIVANIDLAEGTELFEEIPLVSWPMDTLVDSGVEQCWWCLKVLPSTSSEGKTSSPSRRRWCSGDCAAKGKSLSDILDDAVEKSLIAFHSEERARLDDTSLPISVVSVARCIGTIATRIISVIERQQLTLDILADPAVMHQVFGAATKPFNRLVEPPLNSEFKDINIDSWVDILQKELRQTLTRALLRPLIQKSAVNDSAAETSEPSSSAPPKTQVAKELVEALVSKATINTLVGQLTINSQALNTVVPQLPGKRLTACIICMGAAVFTLQSNFNHSCDPNAMVSASPERNHEIVVVAKRPITKGEEVTISYIVADNKSKDERQEELQAYFFTCQCSVCGRK
ncbi:Hypothetical protein, putative [Bodo saltans]|uniref:SET domain-containing protein n=1 Tax=Bodo saltans TaxID=75058 RepID=A0A0S4IN59_BODSA|nr:Hypothetical protein, putative [Bodo saltans]|eukprot:CUE73712.1 Hypothetical protein, putative [Bodo saltans]